MNYTPDPRVAGPSIYFDSRLDSMTEVKNTDEKLLAALGKNQNKVQPPPQRRKPT
jgi:hypothetical protein